MAEVYLGEIRWFPFSRIPSGWHPCDGSLLPLRDYAALYSVLGTMYGGNGTTTFGLPDLRGRTTVGWQKNAAPGSDYSLGKAAGAETVTLSKTQIPPHTHEVVANTAVGSAPTASNSTIYSTPKPKGTVPDMRMYGPYVSGTAPVALDPSVLATAGSGAAHENMQPYLTLSPCIAIQGYYPTFND